MRTPARTRCTCRAHATGSRGPTWCGFDESHSHAPRLFLHLPQRDADRATLAAAGQVVLVDDELSTGNTFVNLVAALRRVMPALSRVHIATIADFTGDAAGAALRAHGLPLLNRCLAAWCLALRPQA
jgi:hypothetical protein